MGKDIDEVRIAFIGYGALAIQIENYLVEAGYNSSLFFYYDDIAFNKKKKNSLPFYHFRIDNNLDYQLVVSLGYKHLSVKGEIIKFLTENNRSLFTFIHSTSYIHPTAHIDKGVIIYPGCIIDQHVNIKSGTLLNCGVIVSHNSKIGPNAYISPGAKISGNVTIGKNCFLGTGSIITNNIKIGDSCIVGIGSVVTKNLLQRTYAIGNPLQIKKEKFALE